MADKFYTDSSKIEVYPSTRRSTYQPTARLMSEATIVRTINKLIDKEGFVISDNTTLSTDPFEFNIYGYYFKVDSYTDITNLMEESATEIWANIILDSTGNYVELQGQDELVTGTYYEYKGVYYTTTEDADHSLLILKKEDDAWTIPAASKIKFGSDTFILSIDGGEI